MSYIDYKNKEYECLSLIKCHPEIFTYNKQNDIYYSQMFCIAIGNKRQLQKEIEKYCKTENDKNKVGRLCESYSIDDVLVADFKIRGRCIVLPIASYFIGRDIENQIKQIQKNKINDKYLIGTVEAQYDNYLSSEEEVDLKEANYGKELPKFDKSIEME